MLEISIKAVFRAVPGGGADGAPAPGRPNTGGGQRHFCGKMSDKILNEKILFTR